MSAPLLMASVALLAAAGAVTLFLRPTPSEAAVYRHRIAATMLAAAALTLGGFAAALYSWGAAS